MYGVGGMASTEMTDCSALLRHFNADELKGLLNDEGKLNGLIAEQVGGMFSEKEMLLSSNKSLAEFNLSREPRLNTLRAQLAQTYEQAVAVFSEAEAKKNKLEEVARHNSLDITLAILQTAAAQSEEESEASQTSIAEKFLEGGLDVESFLDDFQTKRKVAHLRRIKVDKMTELLESGGRPISAPPGNNMNWNSAGSLYANHQAPMMTQNMHYGH